MAEGPGRWQRGRGAVQALVLAESRCFVSGATAASAPATGCFADPPLGICFGKGGMEAALGKRHFGQF